MQTDIRRSSLSNLQQIAKQLDKLRSRETNKQKEQLLSSIATSFDLLHNDLIMLFNHNFYLSCKLAEKEQTLAQLEQRCNYLEEKAQLSMSMTKIKYQKQIHALKYQQFKVASNHQPDLAKQFVQCLDSDLFQGDLPTPSKTITLRDTRSALDNKETLSKPKTSKEEFLDHEDKKFDLEVRLEEVMSEQISKTNTNPIKEIVKSSSEEEGRIRGNRANSEEFQKQEREKDDGKKGQLAKLISQQGKVRPLKEKYFSTDML